MIFFIVDGEPKPQGSKTLGRNKHGQSFMREANKGLKTWRNSVLIEAKQALRETKDEYGWNADQPFAVSVVFAFSKPAKPAFWVPAGPPDLDKLQRAIGDALEQAGIVKNDSRIVVWKSSKSFTTGSPRAEIWIEAWKKG